MRSIGRRRAPQHHLLLRSPAPTRYNKSWPRLALNLGTNSAADHTHGVGFGYKTFRQGSAEAGAQKAPHARENPPPQKVISNELALFRGSWFSSYWFTVRRWALVMRAVLHQAGHAMPRRGERCHRRLYGDRVNFVHGSD